ncbi:LysM peptidoglycan-binding domain-containing protein [Candidatus Parcubacteria bacterium]|nr:LysM peptidoglycan-binding domain-containing protein [Candidatus Parcubacteria bacterium]
MAKLRYRTLIPRAEDHERADPGILESVEVKSADRTKFIRRRVIALAIAGLGIGAAIGGLSGERTNAAKTQMANPGQLGSDHRQKEIEIQEGDTLSEIAQEDLEGRASRQPFAESATGADIYARTDEIAKANGIPDPHSLAEGQKLDLPSGSSVVIRVSPLE